MALTACRECGTVVPAHAHACPKCGASTAPAAYAVYRPPPPRPVEPERPWWRSFGGWVSAAAWVVIAAGVMGGAFLFYRGTVEADRRGKEEAEVAVQKEHLLAVNAWVRDTAATKPAPPSGPVPSSGRARRMWVFGRVLVDRSLWEREIRARHGVKGRGPPAAWESTRYFAEAGDYPEVKAYLEGHFAAMTEMEKTGAAWFQARAAALAREAGMPAVEVRDIGQREFTGTTMDEVRPAGELLAVHRDLVRMDPRLHHVGGKRMGFDGKDDLRRFDELLARRNQAVASASRAEQARAAREAATFARMIR